MPDLLRCPRHGDLLVRHLERINGVTVEVDHCPVCNGLWLDSGEFERLVQAEVNLRATARRGMSRTSRTVRRALSVRRALLFRKVAHA